MIFWAKDDKGNSVDVKTVQGVWEKYDEPPFVLELITSSAKIKWEYSSRQFRDNDAQELRKLRDEFRQTNQ